MVEEHVMFSYASGWSDGMKLWSVLHESEQSIDHLETTGDLPAAFASIRDRLRAEQQQAGGEAADLDHVFDVPVELAKALTGYCHNEARDDAAFELLADA